MKCPECDFEQPDDTLYCAKCGLSFDAWRELNPNVGTAAAEKERATPVPEEKPKPAPTKAEPPKPTPGMDSARPGKDQNAHSPQATPEKLPPSFPKKEYPSSTHPESKPEEKAEPPQAEPLTDQPMAKKGFRWTLLHSVGLGLILLIATNAFFCVRRHQRLSVMLEETPVSAAVETNSIAPTSSDSPAAPPAASPLPTVEIPAPTAVPDPPRETNSAPLAEEESEPEEKSAPEAEPLRDAPQGTVPVPTEISPDAASEDTISVPTEVPSPIPEAKPLSDPGESNGPTDLLESSEPLKTPAPASTP